MNVGGEGNCEGEENKAGQWLGICVSAAVEYFQLTWPGFFFSLSCRGMKNTRNNRSFPIVFFFTPRACLTITNVLMQSYNPTILGWDYLYGRGCRLACFVSERKRAFLLPCVIVWLGILVEVVELEALPIICNWLLQKIPQHNTTLFVCPPKFCMSVFFSFSWGHFYSQEKLKTMLMQILGVKNKEDYGLLW